MEFGVGTITSTKELMVGFKTELGDVMFKAHLIINSDEKCFCVLTDEDNNYIDTMRMSDESNEYVKVLKSTIDYKYCDMDVNVTVIPQEATWGIRVTTK